MFDPILRRWVESMPIAEVRYETQVIEIIEEQDCVKATVKRDGKRFEIQALYAVGCDGATSIVREALGETLDDKIPLTYTTNAIFESAALNKLVSGREAYRFIVLNERGPWSTIVAIDGWKRWRFSIIGDNRQVAYADSEIEQAIEKSVGGRFDFRILSIVPWMRREMVARSFGRHRMFVAGDAAHLMSPTGGFGMNTGIGDAVDLGWKLAATITGWGGAGLLESYEPERRPVALRNVAEATGNLRRMLSARDTPPPPECFESGTIGAAARRRYGEWFTDEMHREWHTTGIQLGYRYQDSPICVSDDSASPPDLVSTYTPTTSPGARAPHVWLTDHVSTLDLFGRGFVLLRTGEPDDRDQELVSCARAYGVPLHIVGVDQATLGPLYEFQRTLVRPDGHVAWRGDDPAKDVEGLVQTVRGAQGEATQ
jgi:hypothetical protein